MKKIGIFYGTTTGNTAEVASEIAKALNVKNEDVKDVAKTAPSAVGDYDVLILGTSTWGAGDMQGDMAEFMDGLEMVDLRGKDVAFFGLGDEQMTDTFCNAVGEMYHKLHNTGANFIGKYNVDGLEFKHSDAMVGDLAVGLLVDNVNHPEITSHRINKWCELISKEI